MPFVSEAQRKKCYMLYNQDIKAGRTPQWNCKEWEKETKRELERTGKKKLPKYKNSKKAKQKNTNKSKTLDPPKKKKSKNSTNSKKSKKSKTNKTKIKNTTINIKHNMPELHGHIK